MSAVILSYHRRLKIPIFQWMGRFYSALSLKWILLEANDELEFITNFWPNRSDGYTHQVTLIETDPAWILISSEDNDIVLESQTYDWIPEKLQELRMKSAFLIKFPEVNLLEHRIYKELPVRDVAPFDLHILNLINQAILNGLPLTNMSVEVFTREPFSFDRIINPRNRPQIIHPSQYSTFQEVPPELPEFLFIHGLKVNFIPFSDIAGMLSRNEIERYFIDPDHQDLNSPNTILTFFGKNGITYLAKARYDPQSNQVFPPV